MMKSEEGKASVRFQGLFLFLGILSLVLSGFDYGFGEYFDVPLAVAWGLLFLFLSFKKHLRARLRPRTVQTFQVVLILGVVVGGVVKLLHRLNISP